MPLTWKHWRHCCQHPPVARPWRNKRRQRKALNSAKPVDCFDLPVHRGIGRRMVIHGRMQAPLTTVAAVRRTICMLPCCARTGGPSLKRPRSQKGTRAASRKMEGQCRPTQAPPSNNPQRQLRGCGTASLHQGHFHPAGLGVAAQNHGHRGLLQHDAGRRHAQIEQFLLHRQGALLGQLGVRRRIPCGIVKT